MKAWQGLVGLGVVLIAAGVAAKPVATNDLRVAQTMARQSGKLLFIDYGSQSNAACQALAAALDAGQLDLATDRWIRVDLSADDPVAAKLFKDGFRAEGEQLPCVVACDATGKLLGTHFGPGAVEDLKMLVDRATGRILKDEVLSAGVPVLGMPVHPTNTVFVTVPRDAAREVRTWTSIYGSSVKAALLEGSKGVLVLKKADGISANALFVNLIPEDQQYILGLKGVTTNAAAPAATR